MADLTDLFGGGDELGGLSHQDATTLALVKALQGAGDAGTRRTATPLGSIAQNLIPLFAAPIEARQMEQKSQLQSLLLRLKLAEVLKANDPEERAAKNKKAAADARLSEARATDLESQQATLAEYRKDPAAYLRKMIESAQGQAPQSGGFRPEVTLPSRPGDLPGMKLLPPPVDSPLAEKRFEEQKKRDDQRAAIEQQRFEDTTKQLAAANAKAAEAKARNDRQDHVSALKTKASILNGQLKALDQQIEGFKKDQTSRNWFWKGKARPATPLDMATQRELLVGQLNEVRNQILTTGQAGFDPTQ